MKSSIDTIKTVLNYTEVDSLLEGRSVFTLSPLGVCIMRGRKSLTKVTFEVSPTSWIQLPRLLPAIYA